MALEDFGVMIWHPTAVPDPETFADMCVYYGIKWVSVKMLNNEQSYNWSVGNLDYMRLFIEAVRDRGIRFGAWQYLDGARPGPQGSAVGSLVEKWEGLLGRGVIEFVQIDAEGGEWNNAWGTNRKAELYCDSLNIPNRVAMSLCSYRFPRYFPNFPFAAFLKHPKVNGMASPQVYWEFSHNPDVQLESSYAQYSALPSTVLTEFVPIAPTYFRGAPSNPEGWYPTVDDLKEFKQKASDLNLPGFGIYSFDKVWQHYDDSGTWPSGADWMEALTGKPKYGGPPVPPPPPPDEKIRPAIVEVNALKVRKSPVVDNNDWGGSCRLLKGQIPFVVGDLILGTDTRIWAQLGENMYACMVDRDGSQYMRWLG